MKNIIALISRFKQPFNAAELVPVYIDHECPETAADNLRTWCKALSEHRWRQVGRGHAACLMFEFESTADAMLFRKTARHLACRRQRYLKI